MTVASAIKKQIRNIDKEVDAITAELEKLETIDPMSAESWQAAWDKHPDLFQRFNLLFRRRGTLQAERDEAEERQIAQGHEVHEHSFVSGGRHDKIKHSHPGGSQPHRHPHTGPSNYGHRKPKVTAKPTGERLEAIQLTEEENTFDLVITDSARFFNEKNEHVPIGNMPIGNISMFAAETMKGAFRMKCNVRDERSGGWWMHVGEKENHRYCTLFDKDGRKATPAPKEAK